MQPKVDNTQLLGPIFNIANTVRVDKNPTDGAFTSIKTAMDSITTNTSTNPICVMVGPGLYVEDPITIKSYVTLASWGGEDSATITPTLPTQTIITGANFSAIRGFSIEGASGVGGRGLYFTSTTNDTEGEFEMFDLHFESNTVDCYIKSVGFDTFAVAGRILFTTNSNNTITNLKVESTGTAKVFCAIDQLDHTTILDAAKSEAILITGPYTEATICVLTSDGIGAVSVGDGLVVQDGAHINVLSCDISHFAKNIVTRNVGAAPKIHVMATMSDNSTTRDISIEHPGTTGIFQGGANLAKVFVDPASTITITYDNLEATGGAVIVGPIILGPSNATVTDFTSLLAESLPTGLLSGGSITQGTNPLDVNILAGYGYVGITVPLPAMKKLTWVATVLTLPDNTNNYIYVNNSGVLTSAASEPGAIANMMLGRVVTSGGAITFLANVPHGTAHIASKYDVMFRSAFGPVFKSGCITTENVTPLHLNVTGGDYFYSHLEFLPTGGTNIPLFPWYDVAGTWTKLATANLVSNTQYNNTATGLASLTASYFTKHILYVAGDGANEQYQLVYGQAQYSTLVLAELALLATPPPIFSDIITPIAAIIVQQGVANIVEIVDIRPRIGFQAGSSAAASIHSNLLGLTADDHLQYLRTDGTRALTGNLSIGTHNLTSVGTVNGVTVEAHEARHLPNGSDPLTTAAPLVNISTSSTNAVGTANSFARSDHNHAVTGNLGHVQQWLTGPIGQTSGTTLIAIGNTAPVITDGTQIWSQVITPATITNTVTVQFSLMADSGNNNRGVVVALFRNTTLLDVKYVWVQSIGSTMTIAMSYAEVPGTTAAVTYSARVGISAAGTWYSNQGSTATFGGAIHSSYIIQELL